MRFAVLGSCLWVAAAPGCGAVLDADHEDPGNQDPDADCTPPHVLFLNRAGGVYQPTTGRSDPVRNRSPAITAEVELAPFGFGDAQWSKLVDCVATVMTPYHVKVVDSDPGDVPHIEAVFTASNSSAFPGLPADGLGIADPSDDFASGSGLVFATNHPFVTEPTAAAFYCWGLGVVVGESVGIEDLPPGGGDCRDMMSGDIGCLYKKRYSARDAERLLGTFGPACPAFVECRDTQSPSVPIQMSPMPSVQFGNADTIAFSWSPSQDDCRVVGYDVRVRGPIEGPTITTFTLIAGADQTTVGRSFNNDGFGTYEWSIAVEDARGNSASSTTRSFRIQGGPCDGALKDRTMSIGNVDSVSFGGHTLGFTLTDVDVSAPQVLMTVKEDAAASYQSILQQGVTEPTSNGFAITAVTVNNSAGTARICVKPT